MHLASSHGVRRIRIGLLCKGLSGSSRANFSGLGLGFISVNSAERTGNPKPLGFERYRL